MIENALKRINFMTRKSKMVSKVNGSILIWNDAPIYPMSCIEQHCKRYYIEHEFLSMRACEYTHTPSDDSSVKFHELQIKKDHNESVCVWVYLESIVLHNLCKLCATGTLLWNFNGVFSPLTRQRTIIIILCMHKIRTT